jgi:hypothetical protein
MAKGVHGLYFRTVLKKNFAINKICKKKKKKKRLFFPENLHPGGG